jgi:RNA polymerase sigma factor (sigma-70 family)
VPADDVPDLVQEIFVRLLRYLPATAIDSKQGRFRTWLWQVTRSEIADWGRGCRRRTRAEREHGEQRLLAQPQGDAGEPDEEWNTSYHGRILEVSLRRVKKETRPRTWACFEQHLLQGRPSADVAEELGLTANTVYVHACRVLKRVRAQCAEYGEELTDE